MSEAMASAAPKPVKCRSVVTSLDLHPQRPLAAAGLVCGLVQLWDYEKAGKGEERMACLVEPAKDAGACRALEYDDGGRAVLAHSSGAVRVLDAATATKALWEQPEAHDTAVNCVAWLSDSLVASGDDEGCIKLWDVRAGKKACSEAKEHEDYISSLEVLPEKAILLSASGDGTMGVFELRSNLTRLKLKERSEKHEEDFLSLQVVHHGKKIIAGTISGAINIWSWNRWARVSDRYIGHPESVSALLAFDDTTVVTGSADGVVRIVNIVPNQFLGVLGDQKDPIESLAWSHDRRLVASSSHDERVRFYDSSILVDDDGEEEEEEEEEEDAVEGDGDGGKKAAADKAKVPESGDAPAGAKRKGGKGDDDSDDDSDDSDDDSEGGGGGKTKAATLRPRKSASAASGKGFSKKRRKAAFFSDL